MSKEELRERVNLGPEVFYSVLDKLAAEKKLEISGDLAHLPGRGVSMKDEEAESKKIIEQAFGSAGLKVPLLKDVLAGLKVDKVRAQKIMTLLLRDRVLIKLSDDLVFHQSALAGLRQKVAAPQEHNAKDRCSPIQRSDRRQPQIRDSAARISRSRTRNPPRRR